MVDVDRPILLNDLQLAQSAQQDPKAADVVFRRVYPRIFRVIRATVREYRQVEDIAQLAAMQVMKSLGSYGGSGTIEAWAERIAFRTAMRAIRRESKRKAAQFSIVENDGLISDTPETFLARRQLFDSLIGKMQQIPTKRRVPLLLHLAYGYTVGEVSEITEASPNTVKARLKIGFKELREILLEYPHLRDGMLEDEP